MDADRVMNPWEWRETTDPAETLIVAKARAHYPTEGEVLDGLAWADAMVWYEDMTKDGPIVLGSGHDLRIGPGALDDMTREQIGRLTSSPPPLSRAEMLDLTKGWAVNIVVKDSAVLATLKADLAEARIDPARVLVTSLRDDIPQVVKGQWSEGRRPSTGLIFDPLMRRRPLSALFPQALLFRSRADCAVVDRSLVATGVLPRCGRRLTVVNGVDNARALIQCFNNRRVQAVITKEPELAYRVRQDLAEAGA